MEKSDRRWSTDRAAPGWLGLVLALGVLWLTVRAVNRSARRVAGDSMRPTLRDGDLVLTAPAWPRDLTPGRVVVVRDPREPSRATVKRIEATGGAWADLPDGPGRVPSGHVTVRGDDPTRSTDSRTYGSVPTDLVERRVLLRLWPPGIVR